MKTALVTGGNKGIGLEITRAMSEAGYKTYVVARDFSQFSTDIPNVTPCTFDVVKVDMIADLIKSLEPIDVLINNAGYMNALDINEYTIEAQEQIFRVNLEAPVEFIKAVLPHMKSQGNGKIVNVASLAGKEGHPDIWYGATKAGLINITLSLSHTLKGTGVTINAILPGPVATKMVKYFPEERKNFLRQYVNVTGIYIDPKDIAESVRPLIDDRLSYLNGICLEISDGVAWRK